MRFDRELAMSFDLHLQHFSAGVSTPTDAEPVRQILSRQRYTGPDEFGFYVVDFEDGASVEFNASGLNGSKPFSGCAFHIRGISPQLMKFVFDVARAGDFVIFNCQGDDSDTAPVFIAVEPQQVAKLPAGLATDYKSRPVVSSPVALGRLLFPGNDSWQQYRDQVVGGKGIDHNTV